MALSSRQGDELLTKVEFLCSNAQDKETLCWLYQALDILSAKASGILSLNSVYVASSP